MVSQARGNRLLILFVFLLAALSGCLAPSVQEGSGLDGETGLIDQGLERVYVNGTLNGRVVACVMLCVPVVSDPEDFEDVAPPMGRTITAIKGWVEWETEWELNRKLSLEMHFCCVHDSGGGYGSKFVVEGCAVESPFEWSIEGITVPFMEQNETLRPVLRYHGYQTPEPMVTAVVVTEDQPYRIMVEYDWRQWEPGDEYDAPGGPRPFPC